MYIQEIILDGFKSYAQKTVVSGFDPQFNAITGDISDLYNSSVCCVLILQCKGLNGTGKSNILDSICFVLGITNLSQVVNLFITNVVLPLNILISRFA